MLVHTRSGTATWVACSQLFRRYPLAITPSCAAGGYRSMVLRNHAAGTAGFFVLTQARDDLFAIRSWNHYGGVSEEIRPGERVSDIIYPLITGSMPVPRDGALLGWIPDRQVTAILMTFCKVPETLDYPGAVPEVRVMPMASTSVLQWPPFTASPLDDARLWEYVRWGQIVDIVPLVTRSAGRAFWVPSPDRRSVRNGEGYVVVRDNLRADEFWLPAGVYMDHWTLREDIKAPPTDRLLRLPGVVDLARKVR